MKTSLDLAVLLGFQKKYVLDRFVSDPSYSILVSVLEDMISKIQCDCDKSIRYQATFLFKENNFDVNKYKDKIEMERRTVLLAQKRTVPVEFQNDRHLKFRPITLPCPKCKAKDDEIEKLKKKIDELQETNDDLTGQLALCEYEKCQMKEVEYKLKAQLAKSKIKYVAK